MPAPLRIAVVGLGEAGATLHLPALANQPGVAIVGACDPDEKRRQAVTARWRVPVFANLAELVGQARPDVVTVATPPDSHEAICRQAFEAGADVLCEKPFAPDAAAADRVLEAARTTGRLVAVNHEFREMPIFRAVVDAARDRRDGDLLFAQAWQQTDMPPWREAGWRGALARRTLFEAGVHHLDFLIALFGEAPRTVQVRTTAAGLDTANRDALVVATLEFSGGRLALLSLNRVSKGEPQYFEARADFASATYRASFGGRARLSAGLFRSTTPHLRVEFGRSGLAWRETRTSRRTIARNPRDPNVEATRRVALSALDAFRSRVTPASSGQSARDVIAVVDACYISAERRGEPICPVLTSRSLG